MCEDFQNLAGEALAAVVGDHWIEHKQEAKRILRAFAGDTYPHPRFSQLELVIAHSIAKAAESGREFGFEFACGMICPMCEEGDIPTSDGLSLRHSDDSVCYAAELRGGGNNCADS